MPRCGYGFLSDLAGAARSIPFLSACQGPARLARGTSADRGAGFGLV